MANPAFSEKALTRIGAIEETDKMTINGTIHRAGILILIAMGGGILGWNLQSFGLLIGAFIGNLILAFAIIFKPQRATFLSQPYALLEGVLLGSISSVYAATYPGIVSNAMMLTFAVFMLMMALFYFRVIRVTEKLKGIIISATLAIAVVYVIDMVMRIFGSSIPMIHESGTFGILFSLGVVTIAAFNLLLDFDLIEKSAAAGAGRFMEWYGAFALLVTIVWLYLELLRLLGKLSKR